MAITVLGGLVTSTLLNLLVLLALVESVQTPGRERRAGATAQGVVA
jgi:Cu/Ag efflux pump CusA